MWSCHKYLTTSTCISTLLEAAGTTGLCLVLKYLPGVPCGTTKSVLPCIEYKPDGGHGHAALEKILLELASSGHLQHRKKFLDNIRCIHAPNLQLTC
jgi:hypothetical protein